MFIRIYALAVCFAAMMIMAIASGIALYDVVQVSAPELTMNSWEYQSLQSNEAYRQSFVAAPVPVQITPQGPLQGRPQPKAQDLSDAEVKELREQRLAMIISSHRRDAIRSLVQSSIFLLISGVLFFLHWRLAKRLDEKECGS